MVVEEEGSGGVGEGKTAHGPGRGIIWLGI
jgi:hypothetical protein